MGLRLAFVVGLGLLLACSKRESATPLRIVSFTSSAETVIRGDRLTVYWETEGAERIRISRLGEPPVFLEGEDAAQGQLVVRAESRGSVALMAMRAGHANASASIWIEVVEPAPFIEQFLAVPAAIGKGSKARLSWIPRYAERFEVRDEAGAVVSLPGDQRELEVMPDETTTYTLTAFGAGEPDTAVATVAVTPPPTIMLTSTSTKIQATGSVTLSWQVTDASRIRLESDFETLLDSREVAPDSLKVSPHRTTIYTLTASGISGEASASVKVEVTPRIETFEVVTEGPVRVGNEVELRWLVYGAHRLTLLDAAGEELADLGFEPGGSVLVEAAPEGIFELVADNGHHEARRRLTVEITEAPRILSLWAERPILVGAPGQEVTARLHWIVDGGELFFLDAFPGGEIALGPLPRVDVPITETTRFRLTAQNVHGEHDAELVVQLVHPP